MAQARSVEALRALGWVLVGIGVFLIVLVGGIAIAMWLNRPEFTGSSRDVGYIAALLGLLMAAGIVAAAEGAYQVRTRRFSKMLVALVFLIATAFIGAALSY